MAANETIASDGLPHDTQYGQLYASITVPYVLSGAFIAVRFYTRGRLLNKLGASDWCLLTAWVLGIGVLVSAVDQMFHGVGMHIWDVEGGDLERSRAIWYGFLFFGLAVLMVKISILLLYFAFFAVGWAWWAARLALGLVIFCGIWAVVACLTACIPLNAYWDMSVRMRPESEGPVYCHSDAIWFFSCGMNVATDFIIFLLPLPLVWGMRKMAWRQRVGLLVLFGTGFLVCIIAVVRIIFVANMPNGTDITWDVTQNIYWSSAEINTSIAIACIITLRPLAARWFPCTFRFHEPEDPEGLDFEAQITVGDNRKDAGSRQSNTDGNFCNNVALAPPTIGSRRTRPGENRARTESWIDFPGKLVGCEYDSSTPGPSRDGTVSVFGVEDKIMADPSMERPRSSGRPL